MLTSRIALAAIVATLIAAPAAAEAGCGFHNETADRDQSVAGTTAAEAQQTPIPEGALAEASEATDEALQPPRTAAPAKSE